MFFKKLKELLKLPHRKETLREFWLNIYTDGSHTLHYSQFSAESEARQSKFLERIHVKEFKK